MFFELILILNVFCFYSGLNGIGINYCFSYEAGNQFLNGLLFFSLYYFGLENLIIGASLTPFSVQRRCRGRGLSNSFSR